MKYDELEADVTFVFGEECRAYNADKVDAAIDELKREHHRERHEYIEMVAQLKKKLVEHEAENERLNRELEHVKNGDCINTCDVVEKHVKEEIKAKRSLWLMTAEWAEAMGLASCNIANKFMSRENFEVGDDYRNNTVKKYRHRQVVFYKYADYCRKKAEEYK